MPAALIDEAHRQALTEDGLVRLPGLLPAERIGPARRAIQRALARHGLWHEAAWRLPPTEASPPGDARRKLPKSLRRTEAVAAALRTPALQRSVAALLDNRPVRPLGDLALLLTLPNAKVWTVPYSIWHLDLPRLPQPGVPGLQAFAFLDAVSPGGGGTLVVRGSHRLLNDRGFVRSRNVKRLLKREPWFRALLSRATPNRGRFLSAPAEVCGVPVQVVELHGEAGDVVLADLRLLHTVAPNAGATPRLMATQRYLHAEAAAQLAAMYAREPRERQANGAEPAGTRADPPGAGSVAPCNA